MLDSFLMLTINLTCLSFKTHNRNILYENRIIILCIKLLINSRIEGVGHSFINEEENDRDDHCHEAQDVVGLKRGKGFGVIILIVS